MQAILHSRIFRAIKAYASHPWPYRGAGILFCVKKSADYSILLGQRRGSGVWSIPGGGRHADDEDSWATAARETNEEFGSVPTPYQQRFSVTYPFGILGFHWKTFVIELDDAPDQQCFPNRMARDFSKEFRQAAWFPIRALPKKTHWLLYPAIWRLPR